MSRNWPLLDLDSPTTTNEEYIEAKAAMAILTDDETKMILLESMGFSYDEIGMKFGVTGIDVASIIREGRNRIGQ